MGHGESVVHLLVNERVVLRVLLSSDFDGASDLGWLAKQGYDGALRARHRPGGDPHRLGRGKRSADAAEMSTGAAAATAEADRAEDHRRRTPRLVVAVEAKTEHDGTNVIYCVSNEGPADLDSVVVNRPILGDVEAGSSTRSLPPAVSTGTWKRSVSSQWAHTGASRSAWVPASAGSNSG